MRMWFLALLLITEVLSAQSESAELLLQADTAYMIGDYETSQLLYETIIQEGFRDFRVYFNLGNAYYQSGDLGRALLNYRRAQEISPRDTDLGNNLALVRKERLDLQSDETGFAEGLAPLTTGVFNLSDLSILIFFVWTIWFILLGVAIFKPVWRYRLRIPLSFVGIILLLSLLLLGGRLAAPPTAVVIDEVVPVRSGPGEDYLELYQLHAAAEIYVWETKNDWVQFALADGRLGWLPSKTVVLVHQ
jgi:tetratricopeptide (TPR) repeat protein